MIGLSRQARRDVVALARDYLRKNRPEAVRSLLTAIDQAAERIERDPSGGLAAPRPYPAVAQPDRAWTKAGRYWFAYSLDTPPVIIAVFYDAADIPGRL